MQQSNSSPHFFLEPPIPTISLPAVLSYTPSPTTTVLPDIPTQNWPSEDSIIMIGCAIAAALMVGIIACCSYIYCCPSSPIAHPVIIPAPDVVGLTHIPEEV